MKTPIIDFVKNYADSGISRMHMPGHKGVEFFSGERFDITEVKGADVLFNSTGIISESQKNASCLFKTSKTFYSTEGSSLSIKAMLAAVTTNGNKKILAARNVHKSFLYGVALLDLEVDWLYPESSSHICSCKISPENLKLKLSRYKELPSAVYVTSPDYLGNLQDIKSLSQVCEKFNIPLIVDNAHGAYLGFFENSLHPIHLGATICCDSAHKTLPVLTGGAYLHINKTAPREIAENIERFMTVFASTSPSYLTLCSLDLCNKYIDEQLKNKLRKVTDLAQNLKEYLKFKGFELLGDEPLKITIICGNSSGFKVAEVLRKHMVEPEFCDKDTVVLMLSCETTELDISRVKSAFQTIEPSKCYNQLNVFAVPDRVMSIRSALLSEQECVPLKDAVGRICGAPLVSCPPAVPPVMSGEGITVDIIKLLEYYGIEKIDVVKQKTEV